MKGEAQIIKMLAQGPDWEVIARAKEPDITVRQDPEYLHVWLGNQHYEVPARGTAS